MSHEPRSCRTVFIFRNYHSGGTKEKVLHLGGTRHSLGIPPSWKRTEVMGQREVWAGDKGAGWLGPRVQS